MKQAARIRPGGFLLFVAFWMPCLHLKRIFIFSVCFRFWGFSGMFCGTLSRYYVRGSLSPLAALSLFCGIRSQSGILNTHTQRGRTDQHTIIFIALFSGLRFWSWTASPLYKMPFRYWNSTKGTAAVLAPCTISKIKSNPEMMNQ